MARTNSGSPKMRALGAELRRARETAGVGVRELARMLGATHSWVSRSESGARTISPEDVSGIAVGLGLTAEERDRLVQLAHEEAGPNWLNTRSSGIHDELVTLMDYERTATEIVEVAPLLIPGLLQTSDYARATLEETAGSHIEARVGIRSSRRDILFRRKAPKFEAIIAERAILDPLVNREIQLDQLRYVQRMAEYSNVTIRVLPCVVEKWTPAHSGQFMFLKFTNAAPIIHLEHLVSSAFLTSRHIIAAYEEALRTLRAAALDPRDSLEFIARTADNFERSLK